MCVCDDLPPAIVSAVHGLVQRVAEHILAHRDASLETHEQGVLDAWRAEAGAVLSAVTAATTTGADEQARAPRGTCPACGQGCAAERWRPRQIETSLGSIRLRRTVYRCAGCGHRWSRADQTLGLAPKQRTSAQLAAWEARVAALTTFREAVLLLKDLAGVMVGVETLRVQAEAQGAALEAAHQAQATHVQAEQEPLPDTAESTPGQLVVETDGVFVRYRCPPTCESPWHELKLGIVGGWVGTRPDAVLQATSYVAAREPVAAFATRLGTEAARRGALDIVGWQQPPGTDPRLCGIAGPALALLRLVVVLGDGPVWIWQTVATQFATERIEIVDWWHGTQHVWTLAKALYGEGTPATTAWAEQATRVLWEQGADGLLPMLRATTAPTPEAEVVLERERGYFIRNAQRMRYPLFRQQGLPIGSGAVESTAKYLVQQRMKRAGMRWSEHGAHAILQLRCQSLTQAARDDHRGLSPTVRTRAA